MLLRTALVGVSPVERRRISALLDRRDLIMLEDSQPEGAGADLSERDLDLVLVSGTGLGEPLEPWVRKVREGADPPDVICFARDEDASRRAALLALGCLAVLNLRLSDSELRRTLQAVVRRRREEAVARLAAERMGRSRGREDLIAESVGMQESIDLARRIAGASSSVLLVGETGVGKERFARSIHSWSPRSKGPFVPVNCGAIPEGLLESELFGHEMGAFTGAARARRGHFEVAHGGTLFLDEIGELPFDLQVKLLRVLEDRNVQRLGSETLTPVDVRVVAATNRVLEEEVAHGRFRPDLFYRLAVITIVIPPLRERPEDIPALVEHYVAEFARSFGKAIPGVSGEALRSLSAYGWPGNVRELMNVLERAVLLGTGPEIGLEDLPRGLAQPGGVGSRPSPIVPQTVFSAALWDQPLRAARRDAANSFEHQYLVRLLAATGGRIGVAARRAAVNERTLYEIMRKHGLRKESFRPAAPTAS